MRRFSTAVFVILSGVVAASAGQAAAASSSRSAPVESSTQVDDYRDLAALGLAPGYVAIGESAGKNVAPYASDGNPATTLDGTIRDGSVVVAATPIFCRRTQDNPHLSNTASGGYTINTHLRGSCPAGVVAHDISGTTYRSRWWGWEPQARGSGSGSLRYKALNLAFGCRRGDIYSYRTEGRYYSTFSNGYRGVNWDTTYRRDLKCTFREGSYE